MALRRYQDGGLVETDDVPRATWVGGVAPRATLVSPPPPGQTPAVTTGPATQDISAPFPTTIKTLSYGPPVDKPTHDVLYGALTDQQGNQVRLGTQDIAMSPNLYKQYGLKLGQNVDVLDMNGNVVYPNQRLADYSYYHPNKPTTDTIELWGRPEVGNVQIRPSALQGPPPQSVGSAVTTMGGYSVPQRFQQGGLVPKPEAAALQTAGQYARTSDVLTPQNAPQYGLDPATGYIARGTPIAPATDPRAIAAPAQASPLPAPPPAPSNAPQATQTWNPLPILKQILETRVPGIPPLFTGSQPAPGEYQPWNPLPILKQVAETPIPGTKPPEKPLDPDVEMVKPAQDPDIQMVKPAETKPPQQVPPPATKDPDIEMVKPADQRPTQPPQTQPQPAPTPPAVYPTISDTGQVAPAAQKPPVVGTIGGGEEELAQEAIQGPTAQAPTTAKPGPFTQPRSVITSEFGWIDRQAVAQHPEKYPSGNKGFGDFGTVDLSGENQKGVAIPAADLQAQFGKENFYQDSNGGWHASPKLAQAIRNHDIMAEVTNPANGHSTMAPIVDVGPGPQTGAGLDVLHGTAQDLGFTSGKGKMTYRIAGAGPDLSPGKASPTNLADAAVQNTGHLNTTQDPGTNNGELACADAVTKIVRNQLGIDLPRTLSTATLHDNLEAGVQRGEWQKVPLNTPGAIIVSPTIGGVHGHTGIVGPDGRIYSNSSATGNWGPNYTVKSWQARFGDNAYAYVPTDKVGHVPPGEYAPTEGGGDGSKPAAPTAPGLAGQPLFSVPTEGGGAPQRTAQEQAPPTSGGGGGAAPSYSQPSQSGAGIGLGSIAAGALLGRLFSGGPGRRPAEEEEPAPSTSLVTAAMKPANVLGVTTVGAAPPPAPSGQLALAAPQAAPPAAPGIKIGPLPQLKAPPPIVPPKGVDPSVVMGLMKQGFTREQALAVAAKATVSKPGAAAISGAATFRPPTQPSAAAPPVGPPAAPARPVQASPQAETPRGLPSTPQERRSQIAAHAEQAIAEKRPMHISYISAPKEAERYPTRESRTIQYEEHSPEARLMGSTVGQVVGHSLIPVESRVTKEGEPYILGLSTNVMANNHRHINEKLAAMGRSSPYPEFNQKFFNDVEGYLGNLNAGHTGTGQGIQVGTEEHPVDPDLSHVPHKLTRHEADFINLVLNNTKAMAQHKRDPVLAAQAQALRELARAHGTLITEAGETNRMRHEINQSEPKWSQRVLEPSVRSFKSGLIHEVHPSEATLPETIRPGPEYQQLTGALHRAIQRGRPDIPVAVSLHSNLQHNANINAIERAFSEGKINEQHAREALRGLGEDPDEYRYISGSGGLITPYEENPEAITPQEHDTLKDNLRKQWISGKMDVENYRRKAAEVPLPEIAKRQSTVLTQPEAPGETTPQTAQPKAPKKVAPPQAEPEETSEEPEPLTPLGAPKQPKPAKPAPVEPEETEEPTPKPPEAPTTAAPTPAKPKAPKPAAEAPEEPEEAPGAPPAPTEPVKKKAKTKAEKAEEVQVKAEAATDRNDIGESDQRKINRLQKLARGWTKLNAKLHDLSAHAHLTGQKNFKSNDLKKVDIGQHFDSTTEGGNPALDYNNPEHREHAATAILHDIMHALAGTKHPLNQEGKPSSAYGWYDRAVRKTMAKMGKIAPEILTDPEHALAFKLALAITSQGQDVHPNAESAWNIYKYWRQHGEMPEDQSVFGGGPKAEQMANNLAKINDLWDKHGHHELQRMLMERGTVKDLAQKYGLDFGTEKVGNKVNGAMFMGPKIGAFFSNLNGDFSPTTMDLWFSRTLNRMAGNMFKFRAGAMLNDRQVKGKLQKSHVNEMEDLLNKDQASEMTPEREAKIRQELAALRATPEAELDRKKALEVAPELHNWAAERHKFYQKQQTINGVTRSYQPALKTRENVLGKKLDLGVNELSDAPRNASERDNWRSIMTSVEGKLKDAGVKLTNADKQALLWFVEKQLFAHAGSQARPAADYLDAAYMLAHKINKGEIAGLEQPIAKVARRSRALVAAAKPEEEFEEEEAA